MHIQTLRRSPDPYFFHMTHKLFELDAMNREQLEAIAKELDIKVTKKLDDENLAYS